MPLGVAPSACKHGVTYHDVIAVLHHPEWEMSMPALAEIGLGEKGRPNVDVYGGYSINDMPLVVFVDRFEEMALRSEPGLPKFSGVSAGLWCGWRQNTSHNHP